MADHDDIDAQACIIAGMSRPEIIAAIRNCRCPFPVDFTDEFLATCEIERLKHYLLGLRMYAARNHQARRTA